MSNQPVATTNEEIPRIVSDLRNYFNTGVTKNFSWRKQQLKGLIKCLEENMQAWIDAMHADLGSHRYEAGLLLYSAISEIKHTMDNFQSWLSPESCSQPWSLSPGSTKVLPEPFGVVCNFTPFNYPMFLGISTLIPIIAAGNVCLFKPSDMTPACTYLYQQLFPKYLDQNAIKVVHGPVEICTTILEQRFDYIFYTGSTTVGKIIMTAAAKNLTPVLLELGGKSPVYLDKTVKLETACKRLVLGKIFNGGQTCVAPDYLIVHKDIVGKFKEQIVKTIQQFYGDVSQYNDNITHIINERHFDRLSDLIHTSGGNVLVNGLRDKSKLYIGPTVIENPREDSNLMKDEIFGPILPFFTVNSADDAIKYINRHEKPLALYVLTTDDSVFKKFVVGTSSGAIMQNDVTFHVSSPHLPFGGVGNSGMGKYHGKYGVIALSNLKPVVTHSYAFDMSKRYPPYTDDNLKALKKFI